MRDLYVLQGIDFRGVPCPRCKQEAGKDCVDSVTRLPLYVPHPERVAGCKKPVQRVGGGFFARVVKFG